MTRNPPLIAAVYASCMDEMHALSERKDLSSFTDVSQMLAKSLLLACASFYEDEVVRLVRRILESGNYRACVRDWLYGAAVEGQFYKWFDFRSAKNTNPFLAKLGPDFKQHMRSLLDARDARKQAERDFLDLCKRRNECVHRNFAAYSLDLTLPEIYDKHRSAMSYIRAVEYGLGKWILTPTIRAAVPEPIEAAPHL